MRDRVLRVREDIGHMAPLDNMAGVDHHDLLGKLPDHRHLMGDQHNGDAKLTIDAGKEIKDRARGLRIERRSGFVREEHIWAGCQRSGDADALFLSA